LKPVWTRFPKLNWRVWRCIPKLFILIRRILIHIQNRILALAWNLGMFVPSAQRSVLFHSCVC
jgi:hypothetical protein